MKNWKAVSRSLVRWVTSFPKWFVRLGWGGLSGWVGEGRRLAWFFRFVCLAALEFWFWLAEKLSQHEPAIEG